MMMCMNTTPETQSPAAYVEAHRGMRRHALVTEAQKKTLIKQFGKSDQKAVVRLFCLGNGWAWYLTGFDGEDTFEGWVDGWEVEFGGISYRELEQLLMNPWNRQTATSDRPMRGMIPAVERDSCWQPKAADEVVEMLRQKRGY